MIKILNVFSRIFIEWKISSADIVPDNEFLQYDGKIDGAIMCRNTLDHCADPIKIMDNIVKYAAPGCFLFLWTDLWHKYGVNEGHRNICEDVGAFKNEIESRGFEIIYEFNQNKRATLNIGINAVKL